MKTADTFAGLWYAVILKTEMLICQLKDNLGVNILFGKITHHLDPRIRKELVRDLLLSTLGQHISKSSESILVTFPCTYFFVL